MTRDLGIILNALICPFAALAAVRMIHFGLHRRYRMLFSYFLFLVPYSIFPVIFKHTSIAYFWSWLVCQPLNWLFEVLLVGEICGLVLERYKGLATMGRWAIYFGIAVSSVISLISLAPRINTHISVRSKALGYMNGIDRGINLGLAVFLILMLLLVSRYPVKLSRNIVLNATIFTILFFCNTLQALLHVIFDMQINPAIDVTMAGVAAASLLVWSLVLTPRGEITQKEAAPLRPASEERALARLDALNRVVLSLGRHK